MALSWTTQKPSQTRFLPWDLHRNKSQTSTSTEGEAVLIYQQQVKKAISTSLGQLLKLSEGKGFFLSEGQNHSEGVADCAGDPQHIDLVELLDVITKTIPTSLPPLDISSDATIEYKEIINRMVHHSYDVPSLISVSEEKYLLPAHSCFLMSDASCLEPLVQFAQDHQFFDVVVLDPPWYNKSARRASKYSFMSLWQIKALPVPQLLAPDAVVCLWVTNKPKYIRFAKNELFPYWSLELIAEWYWVKLTNKGELVVDLDSPHKKPYETILIGRFKPKGDSNPGTHRAGHGEPPKELLTAEPAGATGRSDLPGSEGEGGETDNGCPSMKRTKIDFGNEKYLLKKRSSAESRVASYEVPGGVRMITKEEDCGGCHARGRGLQSGTGASTGLLSSNLDAVKASHAVEGEREGQWNCKIICSVPCKIHSRKPPLGDLLSEFIRPNSACLEMFARSLTPQWTSWGNEVLKFQSVKFFNSFSP